MGNWTIAISGHGCHNNQNPEIDSDAVAREAVASLLKQNQNVTAAEFRSGNYAENLVTGAVTEAATAEEHEVFENKRLRRDMDEIIQRIAALPKSRPRSIAITKLEEAVMWVGQDLKRLNTPNPYPDSRNPENLKIEPTEDGIQFAPQS